VTIKIRPAGLAAQESCGRRPALGEKTIADPGRTEDTCTKVAANLGPQDETSLHQTGPARIESHMPVTLDQMKKGSKGKIISVLGGRGAAMKLSAQGISPGMTVEKISALRGGPVVLRIGRSQVAIGLGLARKVLVEVEED
jgi:ferrous iron transport protein A